MQQTYSLQRLSIDGYEHVYYMLDATVGLEGYIAIHSTKRGPALGGTRLWSYASKEDALTDVLRLAKGMSYKAAAADLPLGGGKAVLMGNPNTIKSDAYFEAYGRIIDALKGRYITAEDMNINTDDIQRISRQTTHVVGREGKSGNPSPWTALGVFHACVATIREVFPTRELASLSFAIQGVGETGFHLVQQLVAHGVTSILISDINPEKLQRVLTQFPFIHVVDDTKLLAAHVDVLCPCAFGGILSAHSLPSIQAKVIVGSANNVFLDTEHDPQRFHDAGIWVAPDYMANAGGLINVYYELENKHDESFLKTTIQRIADRLTNLYQRVKQSGINPFTLSLSLTQSLID
jgi:leucine dehydrogenase